MHGDDIDVAYDGVGQREGDDDLEFERRHVAVHCYFLERIEEPEVAALGGRFGRCRDCGDGFQGQVEGQYGTVRWVGGAYCARR